MKVPSDLEVLDAIYEEYYEAFANFSQESDVYNGRKGKIHMPIDCKLLAMRLGVDSDIVFGRLYYHLEQKYGYARDNAPRVAFFSLAVGEDRHCVNFPLLASVLAGLQEESNKFRLATWLSTLAIVISIAAPLLEWIYK
ncbi:hypothetical protein [Pseudomonas cremoricolorata]|uniref:hypothetical protein n=1 Tax=Pseudomonas cremoricolorata TaxID=157783 RepID=UPI0004902005|nr:hypothetical protein [Pseudomonas cremoricolorata]